MSAASPAAAHSTDPERATAFGPAGLTSLVAVRITHGDAHRRLDSDRSAVPRPLSVHMLDGAMTVSRCPECGLMRAGA